MNIFILYGGTSAEHKVSISSGLSIAEAIADLYNVKMVMYSDQIFKNPQELLGCDLVFNALHGGDGENGVLQTFLDLHRIGYTGSGAKASKIAMDKNLTKSLYDYDCKYTKGMSEYIVPADISDSLQRSISEDAVKLYKTIGCRHYARIDFRLNDNNEYHMLEINTLPGMTTTSLLPKAAEAAGLSFSKLIS